MTQSEDQGIVVSVPLLLKKRGGRKEVILPQSSTFDSPTHPSIRPCSGQAYQEALVIAIARSHRWQKLLDEGRFQSISDIARELGLDVSFAARLIRLTLLAPDIIEAILTGDEPSGLSLTTLTKLLSPAWAEQRKMLGFSKND